MVENDFLPQSFNNKIEDGVVTWQSPSNIALVKYWGKKPNQIPANPSISFTLDTSVTITSLEYFRRENPEDHLEFELYFEERKKEDFKPKIEAFFKRIKAYCPYLKDFKFIIRTKNSFPHSSGIASSASGMSALSLCIMSLERKLNTEITTDYFNKKASFLARLGSGSACRSIEGGLVVWGEHENIRGSSDLFGLQYPGEVHEIFQNYQDTILLVDKGSKQVSSTVGHNLMHGHPYAETRFQQAHSNLEDLRVVLRSGDLQAFIQIVESEALTLHSMMMSSRPYFILMKPHTLEIINRIWNFRETTGLPVCFTLDAGANVHVLYPDINKEAIFEFIKNELLAYCENGQYLCDRVGTGAVLVNDQKL